MAKLPENWVSGYDGQRWFFQYVPTGMVQYHFPQEGDEYAEFLLDVGTGPIKLTPEDSLAVEQETKRRSVSGSYNDTKSGPKTSGSKTERGNNATIGEEYGMSATGYFDSSAYYPDTYNSISPLEATPPVSNSEPNLNPPTGHDGIAGNGARRISPSTSNTQQVTAELPESSQQTWSPVGFVAELATQDTVKCAEELAPVELDATSYTPAPIQTNIPQEPTELPTHRTPVEDKTLVLKPTQPATQPVDSYPLTSASFAYPPLKSDVNAANSLSPDADSMGKQPVDVGQNKFQPWKPTQGVAQQSQVQNKASEALPQTSILQNQDSELGSFGRKNSQNTESSMLADIPNTLAPPLEPRKPLPVETASVIDLKTSSIPAVLQPAHRPEESSSPGTTNQQIIPGNQARHDSISVPVANHNLSYTPSVLKPGGDQPNNSLQENEGRHTQASILPHRSSEQAIQASSAANDQPSVTRVNTLPDHLPSANSKMNGSPGFLFFHEIPSEANPLNHGTTAYQDTPKPNITAQTSDSNRINSESRINVDEQSSVVAPLNFVKRHSSKSSQVSSITPETPLGKPPLTSSDEISEVIFAISSFTPQETSAPSSQPSQHPTHTTLGDNSKPSPTSISEGAGVPIDAAAGARPQQINQQLPSPAITMQQSSTASPLHSQVTSAAADVSKPNSVTVTPMTQANMFTSPSNVGIATTQGRPTTQAAYHPSQSIQGSSSQNQHPSPSLPSQAGNPGKVSMSPGPLKPQGNASVPFLPQTSAAITPSRPPAQASNITHTNLAQPGAQSNPIHHTNNAVQQTQANMPTSHVNGYPQIPVATSVQQALHRPPGQSNAPPHSIVGPPTFGHPQSAIQKPQLQHPVTVGSPSQQSAVRPPSGHQVVSPNTAQISSQPSYQHSSPVTQSVSPIQSQVSSPAQSIASLHVSQSSTPSSTFATMNTHTGPNANVNQTNIAPIRPSSVPAHALSQQIGNPTPPFNVHSNPSSPAGLVQAQSPPTSNPSAKPYPMLPGQVTPLPSQVGSAFFPPPVQHLIPNNHAKPTANTQQTAVGQQPMQTTPGGPIQHHAVPGQANPMLNPQGNVAYYGPASSQAQMKPQQQQTRPPHSGIPHAGGYQPSANQPQPQHTVSYTSSIATDQPHNSHTTPPPSAGSFPSVGQQTFPPPPVAQGQQNPGVTSPVTSTQGKPFTSAQAATAITDAGKGMKKWAKGLLKNPAFKQTAVGFTGAVMAESVGVSGAAGAHLASSLYTNANRPPLAHAQTAPAQAHGIPGAVPQHQSVQIGQQHQPGKPQPLHTQPNYHPGHPQAGHHQPGHPQPGHPQPGHPQPGHPHPSQHQSVQLQLSYAQSGHPQLGHQQPGHPQPAHPQPAHPQPAHPQPSHPQQAHPQQAHSQPVHQPVGAQMPGRPPIAQNPQLAAGVAVNFNAQAQAQVGFNQQYQYPLARPVMVNIPPPPPLPPPPAIINVGAPSTQAQAQVNVDAANLANAAVIVGSAVGAAFHHNNSQPQQGHAQSNHTPHSESHNESHGYATENHGGAYEQAYGSSVPPPPATYMDNSYVAADTTYADNSSYSINNTYIDNTEVVNNTIYIDDSTAVVSDMTYNNTGYADAATYSGTEITTDMALDVNVNSAVYTDSSATGFSMDESMNMASSSDFTVASADYSGGGWGDFDF